MLNLYLVRHGEKVAIPFDPPLTPIGKKQAEMTADLLKDIEFNVIVSSPKLRTKQTAEIIAAPHALPVMTDERLIERLEWEGDETFDEFIAEWMKTDMDRRFIPRIGESSVSKGKIMKEVVDELSAKYANGNILIVTHGGAMGDVLRHIFGEETLPHVIDPATGAPHINISECSVTILEKNSEDFQLTKLNDISHLSIPLT